MKEKFYTIEENSHKYGKEENQDAPYGIGLKMLRVNSWFPVYSKRQK